MEPVELTSLEALQERIEQDGVITVTRGIFAVPMAMTDRPGPPATKLGGRVARFWWTPDYPPPPEPGSADGPARRLTVEPEGRRPRVPTQSRQSTESPPGLPHARQFSPTAGPLSRSWRHRLPNMQQAGSITIMAHDEPAAQLLSCLREHVRELKVGIAEPDGNHVWVTDHSASVASPSRPTRRTTRPMRADPRDLRLERTSTSRPSATGPLSPPNGTAHCRVKISEAGLHRETPAQRTSQAGELTSSVSERTPA